MPHPLELHLPAPHGQYHTVCTTHIQEASMHLPTTYEHICRCDPTSISKKVSQSVPHRPKPLPASGRYPGPMTQGNHCVQPLPMQWSRARPRPRRARPRPLPRARPRLLPRARPWPPQGKAQTLRGKAHSPRRHAKSCKTRTLPRPRAKPRPPDDGVQIGTMGLVPPRTQSAKSHSKVNFLPTHRINKKTINTNDYKTINKQ